VKESQMTMSLTRKIAIGVGVFYLAIGAIGLLPAAPFQLGFATDPAHDFAHLFVGLLALWGARAIDPRPALTGGATLLVVLILLSGAVPLLATSLYFVSAVLVAYAAFGETRSAATA
jgi:hypothetical protein